MVGTANSTGVGGFYPRPLNGCGPVEAFAKKKSKLNTKSPRGEGVLISRALASVTACTRTYRFFFCVPEFESIKQNQRIQSLSPFSGLALGRCGRRSIYFRSPRYALRGPEICREIQGGGVGR